jgi:hypothetical protein
MDAVVEVDDVVIGQADAARRCRGADGLGLVRAVDSVERISEIHGARPERVGKSTCHVSWQLGFAPEHVIGRGPIRPFLLHRDFRCPGPGETLASDADAVAQCLAARHHEIEPPLAGADGCTILHHRHRRKRADTLVVICTKMVGLSTMSDASLVEIQIQQPQSVGDGHHTFPKGHPRYGGRQKGTRNKLGNGDVRQEIFDGLNEVGFAGKPNSNQRYV